MFNVSPVKLMENGHSGDEQLLKSARAEDFEILMRRYQTKLFAICFRLMRDRDLASELWQEALYRAYKNRQSFQASGSVSGWLTRITVNTCLNELKKRQRLVFTQDVLESSSHNEDPAIKFETSEKRREINQALEKLSPLRRTVVSLVALGHSYQEIADSTEVSVSQIKSELYRARQKLRQGLEKRL